MQIAHFGTVADILYTHKHRYRTCQSYNVNEIDGYCCKCMIQTWPKPHPLGVDENKSNIAHWPQQQTPRHRHWKKVSSSLKSIISSWRPGIRKGKRRFCPIARPMSSESPLDERSTDE